MLGGTPLKKSKKWNVETFYPVFWAMLIWATASALFCAGLKQGRMERDEAVNALIKRYESAIYVTVDETGAWLGSAPGAKESPLYNGYGQQVGNKDEVMP